MSELTIPKQWASTGETIPAREYSLDDSLLEQLPSYNMYPEDYSSCPYSQDYDGITLVIQPMYDIRNGEGCVFWTFLRDRGFCHMRPFGLGVFDVDPGVPCCEANQEEVFRAALEVLSDCMQGKAGQESDNIDLDKELFSFYHVVPDKEDIDRYLNGRPRMTVDEAAEALGCASTNVKKLVSERNLDAYWHRGRIWVMEESVRKFDLSNRRFRVGRPVSEEDSAIRDSFRTWLIDQGYSELTPSGRPSTVHDYVKRIDAVAEREGISLTTMAQTPETYRDKYEIGGPEEEFGSKSHNAYRAALRCFAQKFGNEG